MTCPVKPTFGVLPNFSTTVVSLAICRLFATALMCETAAEGETRTIFLIWQMGKLSLVFLKKVAHSQHLFSFISSWRTVQFLKNLAASGI